MIPGLRAKVPHAVQYSKKKKLIKLKNLPRDLVVQWLGLRTPNAEGPDSIPGQGTRSHML